MGCYDSIMFKCPNCGEDLEAQSKSGECVMATYGLNDVPPDVASDANRHAPFFCKCGASWNFRVQTILTLVRE
jgi:hypothetical protein